MVDYEKVLIPGISNRMECDVCGKLIRKEVPRYRAEESKGQTKFTCTICAVCFVCVAQRIDKKLIKKELLKRAVEEI